MKYVIDSRHIQLREIRSPNTKKIGWEIACLICNHYLVSFIDPFQDGYLRWYRDRHYECLKRPFLTADEESWLRHATGRIKQRRKKA